MRFFNVLRDHNCQPRIISGRRANKDIFIQTKRRVHHSRNSLKEILRDILLNLFYLFIFGCVGSSLLCTGFVQLRRAGATLCCGARASHCGGFSACGALALGTRASVVVARGLSSCGWRALECRFGSCGAWAQLLRGMWDLPVPGLEPVSPALAGGFLTTAPPGKSRDVLLKRKIIPYGGPEMKKE